MEKFSSLKKLLLQLPELELRRQTRAVAIIRIGKNGSIDILRHGITREQFKNEILPYLMNSEERTVY